jgi:hypothetical protein
VNENPLVIFEVRLETVAQLCTEVAHATTYRLVYPAEPKSDGELHDSEVVVPFAVTVGAADTAGEALKQTSSMLAPEPFFFADGRSDTGSPIVREFM